MNVRFADHLPACLAEDPFLWRLDGDGEIRGFLAIFDALANTVEMQISGLENVVDVAVAPDRMVRWLGGWLDIDDIDPSSPIDRQRGWVQQVGRLLWWRGTKEGVEGMLRVATGEDVAVIDSGAVYRQFEAPAVQPRHVRVMITDVGWTTEEHILTLLRRELPAEVTFELRIGGRQVWPKAPAGER